MLFSLKPPRSPKQSDTGYKGLQDDPQDEKGQFKLVTKQQLNQDQQQFQDFLQRKGVFLLMIEKFNFIKDWKRYRKTAAIKYDWETYEEQRSKEKILPILQQMLDQDPFGRKHFFDHAFPAVCPKQKQLIGQEPQDQPEIDDSDNQFNSDYDGWPKGIDSLSKLQIPDQTFEEGNKLESYLPKWNKFDGDYQCGVKFEKGNALSNAQDHHKYQNNNKSVLLNNNEIANIEEEPHSQQSGNILDMGYDRSSNNSNYSDGHDPNHFRGRLVGKKRKHLDRLARSASPQTTNKLYKK